MVWAPKTIEMPDFVGLELKYRSVHLEENYPGNLDVSILYKLTHKNELLIEYKAVTDRTTVVNLTNHTYYKLAGNGSGTVSGFRTRTGARTRAGTGPAAVSMTKRPSEAAVRLTSAMPPGLAVSTIAPMAATGSGATPAA